MVSNPTHKITIARSSDLSFVMHLQRTWSNQVGFLPKPALERYIDNRAILLVHENDQPAGYLSWQLTRKGLLRLMQIAVHPDLLRDRLGSDVMTYIETAAKKGHCSTVRFQTRIDLDANLFCNTLSYRPTAIFQHPTARKRPLIEWTKCLIDPCIITEALFTKSKRYQRRKAIPEPSIAHPRSTVIP